MAVIKKAPSDIAAKIAAYVLTAGFALLCILPMWHVIMASLSDPIQLAIYEGFLFKPLKFSFEGYKLLFSYHNLWRSYFNTVVYTVSATTLGLVLDLLAAYVLSRKNLMFKRALTVFIIVTMLFNGGVIPLYLVVRTLNLTNTMGAMIIPACCNAMSIIMLKEGMAAVDDAIGEAAQIDGAGYGREFFRITVPLVWPTVVTLIVLGMTNVLVLYLQPYLLTGGEANTYTIAMSIFMSTASYSPVQYCEAAAKGLLFTVVWAPVVIIVRKLVSRCYSDVDY